MFILLLCLEFHCESKQKLEKASTGAQLRAEFGALAAHEMSGQGGRAVAAPPFSPFALGLWGMTIVNLFACCLQFLIAFCP